MKKTDGGFGYIELLLTLAIVAAVVLIAVKSYHKKPVADKETQKVISEQGIDTTNYSTLKDSVRKKLQAVNDSHQEDLDKVE